MTSTLATAIGLALLHGAIAGGFAAAEADWAAFKTWTSFSDVKAYNWGVALFNWGKGALIGAGGNLMASGVLAGVGITTLVLWRVL